MPDLFGRFTLKDVTLRNRSAMSPTTMHRSVDGAMGYHVMLYGSRAAGGFRLRLRELRAAFFRMIVRDIPTALA